MSSTREPDLWWSNAVVYQVYPRSFQDSDGDGIGDLRGVIARLEHLSWLGVDALWLSPFYPSPLADMGYDVADHTGVASEYGTLADVDELIARAHEREIRVLLDLVPSHTSIEHPWFRLHPDWYVWAHGEGPPNNWLASFGGPAWTRDERTGGWYLHSFYPEQPDLDWRNPDLRAAFGEVVRFWTARGVDGFRVDAIDRVMKDARLRDDPPASEPFGLPVPDEYATLDHRHSTNDPEIGLALGALREAAADAFLVGEVYLPSSGLDPYLEHLDVAFAFEFLHAPFEAGRLREAIAAAPRGGVAWVLSNHDFPRLATRLGESRAAQAALILLTLPGPAFIYQGDEIGMADGPGADPPIDRAGRDPHRHPMQWTGERRGGFTTGTPWLPLTDPERRNVASQREQPDSMLELYRRLISFRRNLGGGLELVDSDDDVLAFRRGKHVVALNLGDIPRPAPVGWRVLSTLHAPPSEAELAPAEGAVFLAERASEV